MARAVSRKKGGKKSPVKRVTKRTTRLSRKSRVVGARRSKRVIPKKSPRRRR